MKLISSLAIAAGFFFASTQVQARDRDCDRGYRPRYDDCDRGRDRHCDDRGGYSSYRGGYGYRDDCHRDYRRESCDREGVRIFLPGIGYVVVRR